MKLVVLLLTAMIVTCLVQNADAWRRWRWRWKKAAAVAYVLAGKRGLDIVPVENNKQRSLDTTNEVFGEKLDRRDMETYADAFKHLNQLNENNENAAANNCELFCFSFLLVFSMSNI